MDVEQLITGVTNYGFPIFLSWYLLPRMEGKLDKLNANIEDLAHTLDSLLR